MQFTRKLMLVLSASTLAIALALGIAVQPALTAAQNTAAAPRAHQQTADGADRKQVGKLQFPPPNVEVPVFGPPVPRPVRIQAVVVHEGETLSGIAAAHGTDVHSILALNDIADPEAIEVGSLLRVLPLVGLLHRLEPGETLEALAARYHVDEEEIVRVNALVDRRAIAVDQELIIPGAHSDIQEQTERRMLASRSAGSRIRSSAMVWPTEGEVSSTFGPRWGRLHAGLDIAAPTGTPIVAATAGSVVQAGWDGSFGQSVIIEAPSGLRTRYAHASALLVSKGEWVEAGTLIARVGSTGYSTGPHLHFEVIDGGNRVDPQQYLP